MNCLILSLTYVAYGECNLSSCRHEALPMILAFDLIRLYLTKIRVIFVI